jgi:hypothetical protein
MSQEERRLALQDLVNLRRPVSEAVGMLSKYPWDSEGIMTLSADSLLHVLALYESGQIDAGEIAEWADAVEGRDDVAIEGEDADLVKRIVFRLSTPEINEAVTPELAVRLAGELRRGAH